MAQPHPHSSFASTIKIEPVVCPVCGEEACIIRRYPDAAKRDGSEIWAFQCDNAHITEILRQR
jgi:hypothetical protein